MERTAMPKTPIDKNHQLFRRKNHIGLSGKAMMDAITITCLPQRFSQTFFWAGAAATVARHAIAALGWGQYVTQGQNVPV